MRVKLSEKCKEEREEICDKIISILNLDDEKSFLLLDLDNDTEKQSAILDMKNKGLRKLIHKKYDTITINECYTSQKCCDCLGDLEYYRNKQMKKEFRLLVCSNCVSCENKKNRI